MKYFNLNIANSDCHCSLSHTPTFYAFLHHNILSTLPSFCGRFYRSILLTAMTLQDVALSIHLCKQFQMNLYLVLQ